MPKKKRKENSSVFVCLRNVITSNTVKKKD